MITVVAATSVDIPGHVQAIEKTLACLPKYLNARGMLHIFKDFNNIIPWQRFILGQLHKYIQTEFALIVQADGYAVHPECWEPHFLDYHYIGAPWKWDIAGRGTCIPEDRRVGNGGFSLRSKAWLEVCAEIPYWDYPEQPEDVLCCRTCLERFREYDLSVAPPEVAARFSFEYPVPGLIRDSSKSFGVHGKWNL